MNNYVGLLWNPLWITLLSVLWISWGLIVDSKISKSYPQEIHINPQGVHRLIPILINRSNPGNIRFLGGYPQDNTYLIIITTNQ